MRRKYTLVCHQCGNTYHPDGRDSRFCSIACMNKSRTRPMDERFWAFVQRSDNPDDCWLWLGVPAGDGYGIIWDGKRNIGAHRAAWELAHGVIPEGMCICHTCDTPLCVNVRHMFLGTNQVNTADRSQKGRSVHGERSPLAKLTEDAVRAIRSRHNAGATAKGLAREYGVSDTAIRFVIRRRSWSHVE